MLSIGGVNVASNKTIRGAGSNAGFQGNLFLPRGTQNVILQNLTFTNPMNKKGKGGGDGVSVYGGRHVWIDHCTFRDCGDGCVDISKGADWVTVSWCKFFYTKQPKHRFTMLVIGPEKKKVKKKVHVTLHHNWWAEKCDQRMPAARKAEVHMYNNYFTCSGNEYATNARDGAEILSEGNYYDGVRNPFYGEKGSDLHVKGNIYEHCSGKMDDGDDDDHDVFKPPYDYKVDSAKKVPDKVRDGAGAR
jgi:pectate lyase